MNKTCNNVTEKAHRCLDKAYMSSNTLHDNNLIYPEFEILECEELQKELSLLGEFIDISEDFQSLLEHLNDVTDDLEYDMRMNLEFVKAYGLTDFIVESNASCLEKLFTMYKSLKLKSTISVNFIGLSGYSRCDGNHKRVRRRVSEVRVLTKAIQLGSNNIYSESGSLLRQRGFICHKVSEAESNLREYDKKKKKGILLFSKLELKSFRKTIRKGKKYVKFAEKYEDYTILYQGRYFKGVNESNDFDTSVESTDLVTKKGYNNVYYVRLSEDCLSSKYRQSGQYVRMCGDTHDLLEENMELTYESQSSEKNKVPMRVRKNRHQVNVPSRENKVSKPKENTYDSGTCYVRLKWWSLGIYHASLGKLALDIYHSFSHKLALRLKF